MAEPIDFIEALRKMIDSKTGEINTCLPAKIVSYSKGRATVQPTPKKRYPDGDVLSFPVLQNVRVCWPSFAGGTAGIKGAITAGDNCLLIFSQQAVDGTDDARRFDLSDAYAIPCDLGNAGGGDSDNNDALTVFNGDSYLRLTASGQLVINAPAGVSITAPSVSNSGTFTNAGMSTLTGGATIGGIVFATHKHTNVSAGLVNTGNPV